MEFSKSACTYWFAVLPPPYVAPPYTGDLDTRETTDHMIIHEKWIKTALHWMGGGGGTGYMDSNRMIRLTNEYYWTARRREGSSYLQIDEGEPHIRQGMARWFQSPPETNPIPLKNVSCQTTMMAKCSHMYILTNAIYRHDWNCLDHIFTTCVFVCFYLLPSHPKLVRTNVLRLS